RIHYGAPDARAAQVRTGGRIVAGGGAVGVPIKRSRPRRVGELRHCQQGDCSHKAQDISELIIARGRERSSRLSMSYQAVGETASSPWPSPPEEERRPARSDFARRRFMVTM